MQGPRDVVITGVGLVTPIGVGREEFLRAIQNGESGVRTVQRYDTGGRSVHIGAELREFEPKLYVKPRKSIKVMCREIQMGVAAATLAMEDARLEAESIESHRFGVVYGVPMLYAEAPELADLMRACIQDGQFSFDPFGDQFSKQLIPLWLLKYLPNMAASHIGIAHQARGPNNSIVHDDVSSTLAIMEAVTVIQRGMADVMLTGGTGSRLAFTPVVYRGESNLSKRNEEPERASRPFDRQRDGMVLGEAACTLVLEAREHAEARGASILAAVRGCASHHRGSESLQVAIEHSIAAVLRAGGVDPVALDHVNAHGLSDVQRDAEEAQAIRSQLGDVPVTAIKSYFGNVGAASGACEMAASLLLATAGEVPATLNYEQPDEACPIEVVRETRARKGSHLLKLSQSGMGQAVALLLELGEASLAG